MRDDSYPTPTDAAFAQALARCTPRDFDGHSDFDKLTPDQRLRWLDELIAFVSEHKGLAARP